MPLLQTTSEFHDVIANANRKFEAALVSGDWRGLAMLYTEHAQLLPPNHEIVSGRQAIQEFWQGAFSSIGQASRETLEVESQDETAHEVGNYVLVDPDRQLIDRGKYMVIWQHENNQWQMHRHIWNSSEPTKRDDTNRRFGVI
jgi:ketosteroid isomerase-like protein